jgi:predicted AAA+ superfamily ATPase
MRNYKKRIFDRILKRKVLGKGAVLIEGPKWCGKTTTAEEIAASKILLARTDVKNNFKSLLEIDTEAALSGNTPMLIDEWQTVPKLWDAVRYTVDHRRKMGQFILTDHSRTIFVPQSYHVRMMGSQRTTVNRL